MNLEERRKAALDADMCFSESALKREYRMQLPPDAEPVKFFKNRWGEEFAVYKISDCIPMPDFDRKMSNWGRAAKKANEWLAADPLFMSIAATGHDSNDQVIEIAVINCSGREVFRTRLRPSVDINPKMQKAHEISRGMLATSPTWASISGRLRQIIEGHQVIIFNAGVKSRLLQQTASAFGEEFKNWKFEELCAMCLSAQAFGATNRDGGISLRTAVRVSKVPWRGEHSASGDALATLEIIKAIAALDGRRWANHFPPPTDGVG